MRGIILGASGRLGSALRAQWPGALCPTSLEAPLEDPEKILQLLELQKPTVIFNCAGYTNVERAEGEEARVLQINSVTPYRIATWCAARNIPLVSISSDYVFEGNDARSQIESDATRPVNIYGKSKLDCEERLRSVRSPQLIFRTSWLYGGDRDHFAQKILRAAMTQEKLRVVNDEISSPTNGNDLAVAIVSAFHSWWSRSPQGLSLYHVAGVDPVSRYEWASEILALARNSRLNLKTKEIIPISSKEFQVSVKRPLFSHLNSSKIREELGIALPSWKTSLRRWWESEVSRIENTGPRAHRLAVVSR